MSGLVEKSELRPYFIYSDGGRWVSKEPAANGKEKIGDCAVRSIVHATGSEYQRTARMARRFGYGRYKGWDGRFYDFMNTRYFFDHKAIPLKTWGRGRKTSIKQFIEQYPVGTYILRVCDFTGTWAHIVCIRNGKIFDTFIEDSWISKAWKIEKIA